MNHLKHPVEEVLNRGSNKAISKKHLMNFFNLTERELLAQIMRERLDGAPILAKKNDGGGYYLPANDKEINGYLNLLKRGIDTQKKVYKAVNENLNNKKAL